MNYSILFHRIWRNTALHMPNLTFLKAGIIYHSHDVHMFPNKLDKFIGEHPLLYDLLNNAQQKKEGMIPRVLQIDGELSMLIHQLKKSSCAPGLPVDFVSGKIREYLMNAHYMCIARYRQTPVYLLYSSFEMASITELCAKFDLL